MSKLEDLQQKFCAAVIVGGEHEQSFVSVIKSVRIAPNELLKIYRNTVFENLRNALQLTFPGIWALLGDECANGVAYAFSKEINNLPNTAVLDDWGGAFPEFLGSMQSISSLPYLKDFANMEWLCHLSNCAENVSSISPNVLKAIAAEKINQVKVIFHPSVFLAQSSFPLNLIKNVAENSNAEPFDLKLKPTFMIIGRAKSGVKIHFISQAYWKFFSCLENKYSLQEAYEEVQSIDEEFDLTDALGLLLINNFIHSIV